MRGWGLNAPSISNLERQIVPQAESPLAATGEDFRIGGDQYF
jgi:antirestriction protein ArdC